MGKKFTLEIGEAEINELMTLLTQNPKKHKSLRSKIAPAFLELVSSKRFTPFTVDLAPEDDQIPAVVINALAALTGYPASSITPTTKLSAIGMTTIKNAQLTVALNKYLETIPGSTAIGPTEIGGLSTVQDVIDLVEGKTP